ncbi:Anaphase-promoting complex, subunit 10/DOC domain-containing protein [Cynara cardunculus var. scolymus]|uniref:Anaphase-promoting complex, subunit 10/DOC domain-containing protein n=1 Tax=Cynara cardunculus var. scolymus TaxID=59895 RepID=A0A103XKC7_CYNCS|nr:Anaphase-promoting complex, subunit 10/DOC domain-containing protein [Cynara cardunculus var. scolymus]
MLVGEWQGSSRVKFFRVLGRIMEVLVVIPNFLARDKIVGLYQRDYAQMATESSEGEEETKLMGGNPQLVVDGDLREMAKMAAWSVSSCKPGNGVSSLRDDNYETYWQGVVIILLLSSLPAFQFDFTKGVLLLLQLVALYVDFNLDESYTPSKISVRAGDGFHNLKEIKTVELVKPTGWVYISLSGNDPREAFVNTFMLQIAILSNHLNGRDTHVRQIKVYGPRPCVTILLIKESYTTPTISIHFY